MSLRHEGKSKVFVRAREDGCGCDGWRAEGNSSLGVETPLVGWRGPWVFLRNASEPDLDDRRPACYSATRLTYNRLPQAYGLGRKNVGPKKRRKQVVEGSKLGILPLWSSQE